MTSTQLISESSMAMVLLGFFNYWAINDILIMATRTGKRTKVSEAIKNYIIREYSDDHSLTAVELRRMIVDEFNEKLDVSAISAVIRTFVALKERELAEVIKDKITPYLDSNLRRLQELREIHTQVTDNLFKQHLKQTDDVKITNALAKSSVEEQKIIRTSVEIAGGLSNQTTIIQDAPYDEKELDKIVDRLKLISEQNKNLN